MAIRSLSPNLMVINVNATVDYYKQFGFELIQSVPPEGNFDWAMVGADGVILMFQQEANLKAEYPELQNQSSGGGLTLLIEVTDLQALYDQLKTHVTLVKEIHKTFYGADEFAIRDPNGFILTFQAAH